MEQVNVYRHEIKYYVNEIQAAEMRLFLKRYMFLDPYTDETGAYWVRSLYFDTIDNKDYNEKIIGYNIRNKIRLRIYDTDSSYVKLELKNKYGSCVLKETVTISREEAEQLIKGECNCLLKYNQNATNKVYSFMHRNIYQPVAIIDFNREAYLYPFQNIRITLDKNLCTAGCSYDLYRRNIPMIPVFSNYVLILEVKFENIIPPHLQRIISNFETQKSQISKYCLGREKLGR